MPEKKIQLTQEGYDNLNAELRDLLDNVQPMIKEQLSEARSQGDLSENADYDAARNQLREVEDRIKTIEDTLSNSVIVKGKSNVVALGSIVEIEFLATHKNATFTIVGTVESDMASGKISNESPVGAAIIGKKVGDEVEVKVANPYRVKIISINTEK
ncbi:MAG: transcription elongation factor GreA [Coprobacillus sp.]|nr:transcription elongation factor GreA [Coprobacillus sp.]